MIKRAKVASILLLIVFLSSSCESGNSHKEKATAEEYIDAPPVEAEPTVVPSPATVEVPVAVKESEDWTDNIKLGDRIVNDDFVWGIIENELSYQEVNSQLTAIERTTKRNLHDDALTDTIVVFSNGSDTLTYILAGSKSILLEAVINSEDLPVYKDIKIGADKSYFKNTLSLKEVPDSLPVGDLEASSSFLFIFNKDKLRKILYKDTYTSY